MSVEPPPLSDALSLPVTVGVGLVSIGVFLVVGAEDAGPFLLDIRAFETEPWRLLTCTLVHGGPLHLLFNAIFLWRFGSIIEDRLGHAITGALFVVLAAAASAAEYAVAGGAIGLSGVVYGLFTFLWVKDALDPRFEGAMDRGTALVLAGWFFFALGLTELGVMNVANVAHAAGAVGGALAGWATSVGDWRRLAAFTTSCLVAATLLRPQINLGPFPGADSFELGLSAYRAGDYPEAARRFEQATAYRQVDPAAWFDLGLTYERLGRTEEAAEAFAKAAELAPHRDEFQAKAGASAGPTAAPADTPSPD